MSGEFNGKLYLRRIRLNSGGYDSSGKYWGHDKPLYSYESEDYEINGHTRALSREDAKAQIRKTYPKARFYN